MMCAKECGDVEQFSRGVRDKLRVRTGWGVIYRMSGVRPCTGQLGVPPASPRPPAGRLALALDLYEYQGKELFRRYGIPVSAGRLAASPAEVRQAGAGLGGTGGGKAQLLT